MHFILNCKILNNDAVSEAITTYQLLFNIHESAISSTKNLRLKHHVNENLIPDKTNMQNIRIPPSISYFLTAEVLLEKDYMCSHSKYSNIYLKWNATIVVSVLRTTYTL